MTTEKKGTILYVDDEESNLRVFKNLYRRNYKILTTGSIDECLSLFDSRQIDLVISDQRMPGMSGLNLLSMIKARDPLVPTILLTGYLDHDVLKDAFNEVGVDKYINKPFDPENLESIIELTIKAYRSEKSRDEALQSLRQSEEKFRGIFDSITDVFIRVDNKGLIQIVSPSVKRLSGYTPKELIGKNVKLLYKNPKRRENLINRLNKSNQSSSVETIIITKSGKEKYVSSNSKWHYNEKGEPAGIESVVRDITQRKLMEQQMKQQRQFLSDVQELANLGSLQWDTSTNKIHWSETLMNIYGFESGHEPISSFEEYLEHFHFSDKKRVCLLLLSSIKRKKDFTFEAKIIRQNGEEGILSCLGRISVDSDKTAKKLILACLDVTETKRKENALAASEEKFRLLAEESSVRIYKIGKKLEVEYANKLAYSDVRKTVNRKMTIRHFFGKSVLKEIMNAILDVFEKEENGYHEFQRETDEGGKSWFTMNITPLKESGIVKSVLVVVNDISEKKKIEETLRDINVKLEEKVRERTQELEHAKNELEKAYKKEKELGKLKSQFVSSASHQFRTPLTVIQSNIALLEMQIDQVDEDFKKKFDKATSRILSEISRMTELMDNVLILGKKEKGKIKVDRRHVDPLEIIHSVLDKHNQILENEREVGLQIKGKSSLFWLDDELLEHALSNLVSNALKYSQGRPNPKLNVLFKEDEASIEIIDFGMGIPKEDQTTIFEPFFRAKNVKGISGTGLGTAIAKEYVELIGGSINLKSQLDKGTTFTIKLNKNQDG